jgi:hypothetical protein
MCEPLMRTCPPKKVAALRETPTVAVQLPPPPVPDTVSVYRVVADGVTLVEPEPVETEPMPLSMDALEASVVVQESVEEPPGMMPEGLAESVQVAALAFVVTSAPAE